MKKAIFCALLALCATAAAAGGTGCVYDLKGDVEVMAPGTAAWAKAAKGSPVAEGTRLRTGAGAWCELLFSDGSFIKMDGGSETAAQELKSTAEGRTLSFDFIRGKALWMAAKLKARRSRFSVRTPAAVCAVRGTDFSITVSTAGASSVGLFDGVVELSSGAVTRQLDAGGEASAGAGDIAVQARMSRLMKAEERRYGRIKARVEALRARLAAREGFIDDYMQRQRGRISDMESRREEKLKRRK